MKKQLLALTALTAIAAGAISANAIVAYTPGTGVLDSPHDMTYVVANSDGVEDLSSHLGQNRVCAFCHTPHHAIDAAILGTDYAPLWSHNVSTDTPAGYASPTFDGADVMGADILMGPSRLCMSCHDGTIAIDQHYGSNFPGVTLRADGDDFNDIDVAGAATGLTNDHPIGFNYYSVSMSNTTEADRDQNGGIYFGIYPLTKQFTLTIVPSGGYTDSVAGAVASVDTTVAGAATVTRTIQDLMHIPLAAGGDVTESYMTCASCHDVHNKEVSAGQRYLLVNSNSQSAICLTCHNK